jgi:hypothetical protein
MPELTVVVAAPYNRIPANTAAMRCLAVPLHGIEFVQQATISNKK